VYIKVVYNTILSLAGYEAAVIFIARELHVGLDGAGVINNIPFAVDQDSVAGVVDPEASERSKELLGREIGPEYAHGIAAGVFYRDRY